MKAAQITRYSKDIQITVDNIPVPEIGDEDILIRVKAAAVNPVDILNLTGAVRLIQDYKMPLTLGNECAGIVENVGKHVTRFRPGDRVYCRLPVSSLGAFAEYVSVPELAAARMPEGIDFATAAAIPLTGLTAYQAITEELCAKPGQTLFITGGSGSLGQMAVPLQRRWVCASSSRVIFGQRMRFFPPARIGISYIQKKTIGRHCPALITLSTLWGIKNLITSYPC